LALRFQNFDLAPGYCNASDPHKRWKVEKIPEGYTLKPMHCSNQALDRNFGNVNANVHIYNAAAGNKNQHWKILSASNARQTSQLVETLPQLVPTLIYPNPNAGELFIKGAKKGDKITVYNKLGQRVAQFTLINTQNALDISHLKAGYYWVSLNGTTNVKLIKK